MNRFGFWNGVQIIFLLCATAIALSAQTFTTLASFNGANGASPEAALVQGADGNFYGTTTDGGNGAGTVFRVTPSGTLTALYSFCSQPGCADGNAPYAGLIQASDGNFYGTTFLGGAHRSATANGGTVFRITPGGSLTTLYSFCARAGCADGEQPIAGLIQASDGNLYGTTGVGGAGAYPGGTIFKITLGGTLTTLYSFCQTLYCTDGSFPNALIQGSDGNFYGTTQGTVFKLTPSGALTTLYTLSAANGILSTGLIQATDGGFYGVTDSTGSADSLVFKIDPGGGTLTTLNSLGHAPSATLMHASDGNFYGTTSQGGGYMGFDGTVFRVTPDGSLTTLYTFDSDVGGLMPLGGLVQGTDGNLYGTTSEGGASVGPSHSSLGSGTVFKLTLGASTIPPVINQSGGIVNAAGFQTGIAANSWITIKGTNLSSVKDTWANAVLDGNLPISLDGVKVSIGGQPAYISYVSAGQINALAPSVAGLVSVTVTNSNGTSSAITATAQTVQPAFFQWGNYAVATRQDYTLAVANGTFPGTATTPAKPGDVIILWGTGFGPTNPTAPVGVETPSITTYNTASAVTVTVGGVPTIVYGAALAAGYAGLYQVAIQIPTSLANGDYSVIATISGAQSPSTTLITVQQ